jgi:aspartate-semialdehyde dehydrogenase
MSNKVTLVGATGAVGREMAAILQERNFPVGEMRMLASSRSAGNKLPWRGGEILIENLDSASFSPGEIVLSSAGGSVSRAFAPKAAEQGAIVIDNTSAFRMHDDVPLVVPEVNPHAAEAHNGIIANPNCSTIQMVVALAPLHNYGHIKRIIVSTYQAVSGAGQKAINELTRNTKAQLENKPAESSVFPHNIAFDCIPHIGAFTDNGFTEEEMKMVHETRKILEDNTIEVNATTVRVPVYRGHSESIYIETEREISLEKARELLANAPGVELVDDTANNIYPLANNATGKDATYVGRVRRDLFADNGLSLWCVSDNLRKGAALNSVQIAELLLQ